VAGHSAAQYVVTRPCNCDRAWCLWWTSGLPSNKDC